MKRLIQPLTLILLLGIVLGMTTFAVGQPTQGPQQDERGAGAQQEHRTQEGKESLWRPSTYEPITTLTVALVAFTAVLAVVAVVQIRFLTRADETARIAAEAAQASAKAAERSVAESAKTLAHTQIVAARDLRPWLTVEALLDSPITIDKLGSLSGDGDKFQFFAMLRVQNVGRSAARNVIYRISAADFNEISNPDEWFESTVEKAVSGSKACLPVSWTQAGFELDHYNDSLAPSERYESRRWCSFKGTAPSNRPVWKSYEFCVSIVIAYMGINDEEIFYTAKVFPIGFPQVPVFQRFIGPGRLPIGTGDVAFGPVRKARAT